MLSPQRESTGLHFTPEVEAVQRVKSKGGLWLPQEPAGSTFCPPPLAACRDPGITGGTKPRRSRAPSWFGFSAHSWRRQLRF